MLCSNCNKVAFLATQRLCVRCKGVVLNNLAVLCELCSKTAHTCAVCLKKIQNPVAKYRGCGHCGR